MASTIASKDAGRHAYCGPAAPPRASGSSLTDRMPPKVWIAIGHKDWRPRLTNPPIRIALFSDELLRRSVQRKKIAGTSVPAFGVAKTVADLFRYRRTVGDALAIEGLRQALRQRRATPAEISRARLKSRACGPRWSPSSWR